MPISKYIPTSFVSTLPSSPVDGQEIYYQASGVMAASGVVWHLRYNASSSSSYKWEYVGGTPLITESLAEVASNTLTINTWGSLGADVGITVPLAGEYAFEGMSSLRPDSNTYFDLGFRNDSTDPAATTNATTTYVNATQFGHISHQRKLTVGVNKVVSLRWVTTTTVSVNRRGTVIKAVPVRVG